MYLIIFYAITHLLHVITRVTHFFVLNNFTYKIGKKKNRYVQIKTTYIYIFL